MANLGQSYSKENLPEPTGFDPIPAGWYDATITGAEVKDTKTSGGQYIAVKYTVVGPTHQGRVIFSNVNIRNQNPKAQEIGLANLNALITSIGLDTVSDTDQLIGGDCQIKVKIREAKDGYDAQNEVSGWKALEGGAIKKPAETSKPAWMK